MSRSSVPRCRVVRALDIEGPKGGNIRVLELACGSRTWTRGVRSTRPPPELAACTSCYVVRELKRLDAMPYRASDEADRIRTHAMLRAHKFLERLELEGVTCPPAGLEVGHSRACIVLTEHFSYVIRLEEKTPYPTD